LALHIGGRTVKLTIIGCSGRGTTTALIGVFFFVRRTSAASSAPVLRPARLLDLGHRSSLRAARSCLAFRRIGVMVGLT
jgi:hypothetical protein